ARFWFFPSPFKPIMLSQQEEKKLDNKLQSFEMLVYSPVNKLGDNLNSGNEKLSAGRLKPEAYTEVGASRTITLTEREINALLAKNTDLAGKLAIDLADNLVSARMLIPVDPDFPILGGKVLRVKAGVELSYHNTRPVVKICGVSIMGVPVPSAWMGGLKNIDLIQQFGVEEGFWEIFAAGVDSMTVMDGQLHVRLKE
ncbi:MAG: arginine N-succinyltransferase, partial [Thermodesulfobacteriota bacterium]|nr:arginine N-succinyltransferase [Thermodesulfobacteriota bacterium]